MVCRFSTRLLNISIASLCKTQELNKAENALIDARKLGYSPDIVTYNTLISAYCRFLGFDAAYSFFYEMSDALRQDRVTPDVVTFNSLIAGATRDRLLLVSLFLFAKMLRTGILPDIWTCNTLMNCYFKTGQPQEAIRVHQNFLLDGLSPCAATINTMINGFCENGYVSNALRMFWNYQRRGVSLPIITYNILINGLCKSGRLYEARNMLKELEKSGHKPNVITYTTVMKCCFRSGKIDQGFKIFRDMKRDGYTFDSYAYCTAISAFIKVGMKKEANDCTGQMIKSGIRLDMVSYNTIANLYCKQGKCLDAMSLISEKGSESDEYTSAILIDGLCKTGYVDKAVEQLKQMKADGQKTNSVAYNCVIDRFCKEGSLESAWKVFNEMDVKDSVTYTSLIHGLCKNQNFSLASKLILYCINDGVGVPRSANRAVLRGLRASGAKREEKDLKSKIRMARYLRRFEIKRKNSERITLPHRVKPSPGLSCNVAGNHCAGLSSIILRSLGTGSYTL
ncbi:hypothetical protein MKW98_014805 [Papaver atlanticum]|uniref:Pentatricopeptide repeat-containing protein n=1 Tax=Papaver atlanticum TaxID=357466 RepID=A0AAD4XEL7_9MAGN|nr:hypothetical protein MKW98_014805 [Papaver atlanticum]